MMALKPNNFKACVYRLFGVVCLVAFITSSMPTSQRLGQSSTMATAKPPQRPQRTLQRKVYGYLLRPSAIFQQAVDNGTATANQPPFTAVMLYLCELAAHCDIKFSDIISVYPDNRRSAPVYCIVAATNRSAESRVPQAKIIEKAKSFLHTDKEPKWYKVCYE